MKYIDFTNGANHASVCILIKPQYLKKQELLQHYINHLDNAGISDIVACELAYPKLKMTVSMARSEILKLLPSLSHHGISYLYVADATYFKALTGTNKADTHIGYVLPCKLKGFEHIYVVLGVNYGQLMYNPNVQDKLSLSLQTLISHKQGNYTALGNIINTAHYPQDEREIELALANLHQYPALACDIETTGLDLDSELFSIAFAYSQHDGIAFKVTNKRQLKQFFESYKGKLIFHNATFDIKHIINHCFMNHRADYRGLLHGLHTMCRNIHDTKIIAYLATNSTAGNELSLKELAHEFTGNYAIDVKDVLAHPIETVLEYNVKDTMATFYLFNKYMPIMLKDSQESIYKTIMLPSIKTITQLELIGMPLDMQSVQDSKSKLETISNQAKDAIMTNPLVLQVQSNLQAKELAKINSKLKTKQYGLDKVKDYLFNPNSNAHLVELFYDYLGLPILDKTKAGQPAVGAKTLSKLKNHTDDAQVISLLDSLLTYSSAQKVLTTFIPAFLNARERNGWHYLHGSFNLGGTLSNRLSSSKPNLQNLPSGSEYGKLVKQCFKAPNDWLFVGSDFASLEDRVNALITKDENKLKVYTDGYDGHSLRAYSYWKDKMPDIDDTLQSINSIKDKYPEYRQKSKAPTFALTYQGTHQTLMNNCGFSEQEAKQIEASYHKLYVQSDKWLQDKLDLCSKQGYIDTAFGLRIRTPVVGKSVLGSSKTPQMAMAEARSVGNALSGQSYCQLTNRAVNEFMERVWASEYKYDIMPVCLIHDAIYLMIKNDVKIVEWVNTNLIECMAWQELPELQHDTVKLEAELDIYYPSWADAITLPNNANQEQILALC